MKPSRLNGPLVLALATAAIIGLLTYSGWRLHSGNNAIRATAGQVPAAKSAEKTDGTPPPIPEMDDAAADTQLAELRALLARETAARETMEAKAAELAASLPTSEDELVVSLGRIEQMAHKSAKLIGLFFSESGRKMARGENLSRPEQMEMMEALQKHCMQIPELQRMEDDAREISRYQASALKEIYNLDGATFRSVLSLLESEFTRLKLAGLTVSQRAETDKAAWETRRDAAMKDLAALIRPMLPADHPSLHLLPGVLNLGEGLRTTVTMKSDGHGSVNMALPLFPEIPSL